jgi:hypothetical protein
MSRELLLHCIERLQRNPPELVIHLPISDPGKHGFERLWSRERFLAQQNSIIQLAPDHPDYGLGHLYYYKLVWGTHPEYPDQRQLRIQRQTGGTHCSPRELILFASIAEKPVPFPYPQRVYKAAKSRVLGRESARQSGAVYPALRPGVANVQFLALSTQKGCQNSLSGIPIADLVSEGHDEG